MIDMKKDEIWFTVPAKKESKILFFIPNRFTTFGILCLQIPRSGLFNNK